MKTSWISSRWSSTSRGDTRMWSYLRVCPCSLAPAPGANWTLARIIHPRSSPTSSTSSTTPLSAGQSPSRPLTSPGRPLASPGQQLSPPVPPWPPRVSYNRRTTCYCRAPRIYPRCRPSWRAEDCLLDSHSHRASACYRSPSKTWWGSSAWKLITRGQHSSVPSALFSPQGSVAPPGINRENYNWSLLLVNKSKLLQGYHGYSSILFIIILSYHSQLKIA